jgi:hypothetical protein
VSRRTQRSRCRAPATAQGDRMRLPDAKTLAGGPPQERRAEGIARLPGLRAEHFGGPAPSLPGRTPKSRSTSERSRRRGGTRKQHAALGPTQVDECGSSGSSIGPPPRSTRRGLSRMLTAMTLDSTARLPTSRVQLVAISAATPRPSSSALALAPGDVRRVRVDHPQCVCRRLSDHGIIRLFRDLSRRERDVRGDPLQAIAPAPGEGRYVSRTFPESNWRTWDNLSATRSLRSSKRDRP